MTWAESHAESERLAAEADALSAAERLDRALPLYRAAAEAEERALGVLDWSRPKTLGITLVSTVALYYRALEYERALRLAHSWLAREGLPEFAQLQIEDLVATIWGDRARQRSGIQFVGREVLVSLAGGDVAYGAAPLDLVAHRVEQVQKFLYRIAEFVLGRPHRKRGSPDHEILEICRPWILQAPAGSYQFAVRVQVPTQTDLFRTHEPEVREIANTFLEILAASAGDPSGQLTNMVPDKEYRATFINMARNLAPDGKTVERVVFRPAVAGTDRPVTYVGETRTALSTALRPFRPAASKASEEVEERIVGTLRGVDLEKDWLKVANELDGAIEQITGVGDTLDDVLGPMVNRRVIVDVAMSKRGKRLLDIQPLE